MRVQPRLPFKSGSGVTNWPLAWALSGMERSAIGRTIGSAPELATVMTPAFCTVVTPSPTSTKMGYSPTRSVRLGVHWINPPTVRVTPLGAWSRR